MTSVSFGFLTLSEPPSAVQPVAPVIPAVGAVVRGRVVRFQWGQAILQIGHNLNGFLEPSDFSQLHQRVNLTETLAIGDEFDVVVMSVKHSKKGKIYISLSCLPLQENSWETVEAQHPIGSRTKATVRSLQSYGAFVEFPSGFSGLVHCSELSWTEKTPKAQDFFSERDEIDVVILTLDKEKRKISAGYRQTQKNPYTSFLDRYPIGSTPFGTVVSVLDYGVFLAMPDGCTGLLHQSHFLPDAPKMSRGEQVRVAILAYDQTTLRIQLGFPLSDGVSPLVEGSAAPSASSPSVIRQSLSFLGSLFDRGHS